MTLCRGTQNAIARLLDFFGHAVCKSWCLTCGVQSTGQCLYIIVFEMVCEDHCWLWPFILPLLEILLLTTPILG